MCPEFCKIHWGTESGHQTRAAGASRHLLSTIFWSDKGSVVTGEDQPPGSWPELLPALICLPCQAFLRALSRRHHGPMRNHCDGCVMFSSTQFCDRHVFTCRATWFSWAVTGQVRFNPLIAWWKPFSSILHPILSSMTTAVHSSCPLLSGFYFHECTEFGHAEL